MIFPDTDQIKYIDMGARLPSDPDEMKLVIKARETAGIFSAYLISSPDEWQLCREAGIPVSSKSHVLAFGLMPSGDDLPDTEALMDIYREAPVIGEIGLGRYDAGISETKARELCLRQIEIAAGLKKPLILSAARKAEAIADILEEKKPDVPILIRRFTGSRETWQRLLDAEVYFSLSPDVCLTETETASLLIESTPREQLLTDCGQPAGLPDTEFTAFAGVMRLNTLMTKLSVTDSVALESTIYQLLSNLSEYLHAGFVREGKALIIAGGEYFPLSGREDFELVIAADRGADYAERMDILPDLIVGDLDSFEGNADDLTARHRTKRLPCRKNDSDLQSALKQALSEGYRDLTVICIMGGRFDHMLANLQCAVYAAKRGAVCRLIGPDDEITVFSGRSLTFPARTGWSLSAFAMTNVCSDICIKDAAYTASHFTLTNDISRGLSNEWCGNKPAVYSVGTGVLAVILSKMKR